jgi:hypothetical protein
MLVASSTGSCSDLASAIVLHGHARLIGILSLPTLILRVARPPLGLLSASIYWLYNQDELFTFRDIKDVKIQEYLITSHLQGHNAKDSFTLHHLAVDPLQVLTTGSQGLLWCNVICQFLGHHIRPNFWII